MKHFLLVHTNFIIKRKSALNQKNYLSDNLDKKISVLQGRSLRRTLRALCTERKFWNFVPSFQWKFLFGKICSDNFHWSEGIFDSKLFKFCVNEGTFSHFHSWKPPLRLQSSFSLALRSFFFFKKRFVGGMGWNTINALRIMLTTRHWLVWKLCRVPCCGSSHSAKNSEKGVSLTSCSPPHPPYHQGETFWFIALFLSLPNSFPSLLLYSFSIWISSATSSAKIHIFSFLTKNLLQ